VKRNARAKRGSPAKKQPSEEQQLRASALKSAQSILIARRKAERELVATKEALEHTTAELSEQREWFQVTLASIGDAVITSDVEGRVTFLNPVAESLTAWPSADAVGQPLAEVFRIVNEQTREVVENPVRKVLESGRIVGLANHTALIARDGRVLSIEDSAAPIRNADGKVAGVVMVFRDVSERRQAEEALRRERLAHDELRNRLAAVVESSDDAIISKTLDGIITTWNKAAENMFGYSADEVIGRSIILLFPHDRVDEEQVILARLRRGERVESYETVRVAKDGRHLNVSLTVSPIRDATGKVIGASKIARDITERKRADEALRESDRRKDEFLATLAHELRNPLAPIRQAAQLSKTPTATEAQKRWSHDVISRQVQHMALLLDDLLDISRITRGTLELRMQMTDLAAVIDAAVETARRSTASATNSRSRCRPSPCISPQIPCESRRCSRTSSRMPRSTPTRKAGSASAHRRPTGR
jgi:PAS domain S-box-containing protein